MFIGLWLSFCVAAFFAIIRLYKFLTISIFKLLAFAIDYFVIVFYAIYYFHSAVTVKVVSGNWIYLVNAFVGLGTIVLYTVLMIFLYENFRVISNILNLFMAFVGVTIALPFTIGLLSPFLEMFIDGFKYNGEIILSNNHTTNLILVNLLYGLVAIPVWRYRMNKLEG